MVVQNLTFLYALTSSDIDWPIFKILLTYSFFCLCLVRSSLTSSVADF